jgi:hypothetical protein
MGDHFSKSREDLQPERPSFKDQKIAGRTKTNRPPAGGGSDREHPDRGNYRAPYSALGSKVSFV